ncbi:hypothetical protein L917_17755 [Phytophthora nicotianae]|uniref:FYVE-type domain-containing protein n=4 Tax=Phytophthora nicotianae TaxID=4792 RepID=W2PKR9_PHYN3|nr:hypothetical protein PPTG_17353 [Phytophthora nicotianae INRA-310]ETI35081.1 hypothetical protein F443_18539 [Phytophthora nicotianae P1569]ETK75352.1 hypothetical protein L915_18032 [Phytophthora nicotianae]KUF82750.1 1-phosphatidylinositol 3-phosphate 5-kinase FAB1 [Phytophthora nicotianae]ETL82020.1 hypothetical protein L917_17755 [Phytophthora nicotianae]ETM35231.1 hypothetical protein L914_17834 [Phytophthora nicotianae]
MSTDHLSKRTATPSARILERVREDATDLALLVTVTSHDWKLLSDKNGTQLYEMTGESLSNKVSTVGTFGKGGGGHPSEFYLVRAATTIRADVNTMLDVLRTSTSEDFRDVMKKIFDKQFESGAIVDSLSCTTPPPYTPSLDSNGMQKGWQIFSEDDGYSTNWVTLRAFNKLGGLDGHRDFTMVCYQDVFERAYISDKLTRVGRSLARDPQRPQPVTGSRLIGVHTFSSMNFRDIPELPKSSKTDRLHFRNSGVIVEELTEEDSNGPVVRVSLLLSLMPTKLVLKEVSQSPRMRVALAAGHEVAKKYRKWIQTLALGVSHFAETAKPVVTMQHLSKMTWIESDHCFLCLKMFRTYRRRHHCRFCGEAVCGSCSSFVNLASFDIDYDDSADSVIVGHRKLDLRMASGGSGRNLRENASPNDSKADTEEVTETRGCNTCVSELQMNLTVLNHTRSKQDPSSTLSQLVNARLKDQHTNNQSYKGIHDPPPPYPGQSSHSERDQVMPMRAGGYLQFQQQKISFSTISSSSYAGLSPDECGKLGIYSSTGLTESMGKAPATSTAISFNPTPRSYSADSSLSAFLARDPDILSLNGLTLSPGSSVASSMIPVMGDEDHLNFISKHNRESYATTAATNEGSNHSQFNYSNMTQQEVQTTERLIREANARENQRMNGRPPLNGRPQYQQDCEQSPVGFKNKVYHMPRTAQGLSPSHSLKSSYSSGSAHSDLIQLNSVTNDSAESTKVDFVVFDNNQQAEVAKNAENSNDMIPLRF